MSYNVKTTSNFEREAKALFKRHRSLKNDLSIFIDSLEQNPFQGDELTPGVRKIRMAITSKGRGKSGGARIITYTVVISENFGNAYLLSIYDKSDFSTVDIAEINNMINSLEL